MFCFWQSFNETPKKYLECYCTVCLFENLVRCLTTACDQEELHCYRCIWGMSGVMEWVTCWWVLSFWSYYLREMFGAELCIYTVLFLLSYKKTEKINFTKYMHFSSLYWKLKFLSVCYEISAFLRERKKRSNRGRRRWMLLPLLNIQVTSSFSQGVRNTDSVSFLSLRIFVNLLGIKQVSHLHS